jgi:CRISPR-associated endonuclease/helicase Cas3
VRELISHPGVALQDHLTEAGNHCASLLKKQTLNLAFPQDDLVLAGFVTGACHDFGKAKKEFQEYIWSGKRWGNSDHSLISSLFTFLVAKEVFGNKKQPSRLLTFACAYAVNRHHGILVNLDEAFSFDRLDYEFEIAKRSLNERIWDFKFALPKSNLCLEFGQYRGKFLNCSPESTSKSVGKFATWLRGQAGKPHAVDTTWLSDLYFALLLVISTLTEADRASVIRAPSLKAPGKVDAGRIKRYVFNQPEASPPFQKLRERAWKEIEGFANRDFSEALRLTLPTGLGKTLMGLYLAAEAQRKARGPVIYALPYLSIIEQTTEVAHSIFPSDSSEVSIIQHHSLSFPQEKGEQEIPNFEQARFSLESWDADLVITTFDQVFYSFLSPDRGFIQRFFQLPGSVLLLDEVQTLPARLTPAVQDLLQKASEKLGTQILYMTATHPPFLKEAQPLLRNDHDYFEALNRTKLILHIKQPLPFSKYLQGLADWLREKEGENILFVSNTIRCSLALFDHLLALKGEDKDFDDLKLFYLSGNVAPVYRLKRIQEIKETLSADSHPWLVVVSTQCVEAGVDIDMDEIVRDFAPWDSIMQVCGRANRFSSKDKAAVHLYRWVDDLSARPKEFHSYIYDDVFTGATLDLLKKYDVVKETEFLSLQTQYAQMLEEWLSQEKSRELLEKALSWQFKELDFRKLFRGEDSWKVSLFCVADQTAEKLRDIAISIWSTKDLREALDLLQELCNNPNLFEPLAQFLRITPQSIQKFIKTLYKDDDRQVRFQLPQLLGPMFQAYTISIPVRSLEELREKVSYISKERVFPYIPPEYYDALRGFSPKGKDDKMLSTII